ncbi:MAG: hypothetical protein HOV83_27685 [Catenulispora sp.]|nr:hypothetical protein [Catenulispora sp.]
MLKFFPLSRVWRGTVAAAVTLVAVFGGAAPASADAPCSRNVDITAVEPLTYTIDTHGTLVAGLVRIGFWNDGAAPHQAQLFRLNDGVSFAKWQADIHGPNAEAAIFADGVPTGGANVVAPGGHQYVEDVLQGGTYVVTCFVPGPDGVPHIFMGMYKSFDVAGVAPSWPEHPGQPVWDSIQAHDLTFTMPPALRRGALVRFDDTDAEDVHEVTFGKLLPGKTVDDAKAWFAASAATPPVDPGPAPFTFAGGHGAVVPGAGGWFQVDADAGRYVAFCLVPDEETGMSHASMGMVVGFTVLA